MRKFQKKTFSCIITNWFLLSKHKNKKINGPVSSNNTLITTSNNGFNEQEHISFDFSFFQTGSIRLGTFNNYFESPKDAINSVGDLFNSFSNISQETKKDFFNFGSKKKLHQNKIDKDETIDSIEKILQEGYGLPKGKVDEFERNYVEFAFSDGKRIIGTFINGSVFAPLFIDNNHLVCIDSSRDVEKKQAYKIKGIFGGWSDDDLKKIRTCDAEEILNYFVDKCKDGDYASIGDIREEMESFLK